MLQKGAIRRASFDPRQFISNLFIIPKKFGDLRPVINLKPLNEFVQYHHFEMEGLNTLLDLLSGSEFFTTIDLKDAYFSIPIHADHYKYLRFAWNSTLFEFICLPFGLSSAPRVFTKVLKPFVASIRNKGIRLVIYLDDMAIISSSRELSSQEAAIVVQILESLGFITNKEKSVLIPSQKIVFLGYVIDSVAMTVSLPEEKLNKLKEQTLSLSWKPQCSIRELAHVIRLIVSSFPAIKPARLYYRDLEVCKLAALSSSDGDYNAIVYLSQLARDSLRWFVVNSHLYNGTRISKPSKVMTMTTDASHLGWGVVCDVVSSSGRWSSKEQAMHINWLELSAVLFGVKCFVHSYNCLVKVFCDNSTAVTYINNLGGMVPSLHAVSKSICEWCFAQHCVLEAFHIPGSSNLQADSFSRQYNRNLEWKLHPTVFKWISNSLLVPDALVIAPWWPTAHWYPPLLQLLGQRPILLPQWDELAPNSASGGFSSPSQRCNAPSRVACIRDNLQVRGISPRSASYVLKSWRPGTEKQYSAAWKCFCCWCDRKKRNPLQADLGTVCDFLTEQFEDSKKSYSTINSYRSALSSMLLPVDGYSVGEHPIIARLLKGIFHIRPPEPRYSFTWDVNVLLTFLDSWFPLSVLELKQLTLKTAALAALVSAQRSQTLSALSIDFMNSTATGTQFVVNSLLKSSRPGKSSLMVSLPAFPENEKLCAHSTLLYYVGRTASIRQSLNSSQVFVSYGKPYKVVSSATLARWLKVVLSLAGIDTSIFKGHSFRGASTSMAVSLGVPLDVILKAADWKNAGTFAKFYQRETSSVGQFAQAVLTL